MAMTKRIRASGDERRAQIIGATLALLAELPLHQVTTRRIARRIGVSQPALFRHFRSRDGLLLAAVAHTRGELEGLAEGLLREAPSAFEGLRALARGLLAHVEAQPGVPRLLMSPDVTLAPSDDPVRLALRGLVAMQRALVAALVGQAVTEGALEEDVDPVRAATGFVSLVQGAVLQWQLEGRGGSLADEAAPLMALWLDGVRGGAAPRATPDNGGESAGARARRVDARPLLAAGTDPLEVVLGAVDGVGTGGVVMVVAPFQPRPLLALLERMGHGVEDREALPGVWVVEVVVGGALGIVDLRGLEPPEPLQRILEAVERLDAGEIYVARTPRSPRMLLPRLAERGVAFAVLEAPDASALLHVERPT